MTPRLPRALGRSFDLSPYDLPRSAVGGLTLVATALLAAGCGSAAHQLPGAEPAVAPPLTRAPAGRIVSVGAAAEGIAAAPRLGLVAVAVRDPDRIALIATRTGRLVREIRIAGPARHLALEGGDTLLVPEAPIGRLLELPLTPIVPRYRGAISHHDSAPSTPMAGAHSLRTGALPHDAAALDGRVFVADEFGHAISAFAGTRPLPGVRGVTQPRGLAPVGGRVALIDVGADTVTLVNPRTLRVLARVSAGTGLTHDVAGPDDRLYVTDTRGGALYVLATRPRLHVIDRLTLPDRPYGIAADPAEGTIWVTETGANRLVELDARSARPRILASFPTVRQPNTVAVNPDGGEVYVAGADAGVVQELRP